MHISPLEEYALRCAVQLVRMSGDGAASPISASRIAEKEGISVEYVSKIMHLFKKAELVETVRGTKGGFRLARDPKAIPLTDVFNALEIRKRLDAQSSDEFCGQFAGQGASCAHLTECSVRPVWFVLSRYFDELLGALTVADLIRPESAIEAHILALAQKKSKTLSHLPGKAVHHEQNTVV